MRSTKLYITNRIRKLQNYDWSDENLKKGNEIIDSNIEKALEYFMDAEKLDPLNKEIYLKKGAAFLQIVYYNLTF